MLLTVRTDKFIICFPVYLLRVTVPPHHATSVRAKLLLFSSGVLFHSLATGTADKFWSNHFFNVCLPFAEPLYCVFCNSKDISNLLISHSLLSVDKNLTFLFIRQFQSLLIVEWSPFSTGMYWKLIKVLISEKFLQKKYDLVGRTPTQP